MSGFVRWLRFGAAVVAVMCVCAAVLMAPESGSKAQGAKGKEAEKAFVARAVTYDEAKDDAFVRKLAYGDQKVLSRCIELSLKSSVLEEMQGGLVLMTRAGHFEHWKAVPKFLQRDDGILLSYASIVSCLAPEARLLNDFFKRWDQLESGNSPLASAFRANAQVINLHPEALKQLIARAKADKKPEQAKAALAALNAVLQLPPETTLKDVEAKTREPAFIKGLKTKTQVHKPQSSAVPLFMPTWDISSTAASAHNNVVLRHNRVLKINLGDIERGEKQGFDVLLKVLIEDDDSEVLVTLHQGGEEKPTIGALLTATERKVGDKVVKMQNKGRWAEFRFAWVPYARLDGSTTMGSVNTEGFDGDGLYFKLSTAAPTIRVYSSKGPAYVSRGELIRIDRLP